MNKMQNVSSSSRRKLKQKCKTNILKALTTTLHKSRSMKKSTFKSKGEKNENKNQN